MVLGGMGTGTSHALVAAVSEAGGFGILGGIEDDLLASAEACYASHLDIPRTGCHGGGKCSCILQTEIVAYAAGILTVRKTADASVSCAGGRRGCRSEA